MGNGIDTDTDPEQETQHGVCYLVELKRILAEKSGRASDT